MAADLQALMQSVYDFFLQEYKKASPEGSDNAFLAFETIGHPVLQSDFKLHSDDAGFSPELGRERISQLANMAPRIASGFITPSSQMLDDVYSMLLIGSTPKGTPDEITLCANLKSEAKKRFDDAALESLLGMSKYHPCDATPADWYEPSSVTMWPSFSKKAEPVPATQPPPAHPVKFNLAWRLQPTSAQVTNILTKHNLLTTVSAPSHAATTAAPLAAHVMMAHATVAPAIAVAHPPAGIAVHPAVTAHPGPTVPAPPPITIAASRVALPVRARLVRDLVVAAPVKPVSSNGFTLSFNYCIITLHRPWLYQPFLDYKAWYVPGTQQGAFSTGSSSDAKGPIAVLPLGLIIIRDLAIAANWSGDDAAAAKDSLALPPFSLLGSTFQSNTLSCKGMQIIGWICQCMPVLPPQSAPDDSGT